MSAEPYRRKKLKYLVIILLVIVVAIAYSVKKYSFLHKELPQLVEDHSQKLYKVHYDSISVDELKGDVFIKNLVITVDTLRQQDLLKNDIENAPKILLNATIPSVHLVGFKTAKALISKKIICDKIIITDPTVIAYLYPHKTKKDLVKQKQELYKQLLGKYELIEAREVEIVNANVFAEAVRGKQKLFKASNTSIDLTDIRIDSAANEDTTRTFFSKQLFLNTNSFVTENKGKTIEVSNASYNTNNKIVSVAKAEYNAIKGGGNLKTVLENLSINEIRIHGAIEEMFVSANNISIAKSYFESKKKEQQSKGKQQKKQAGDPILPPWLKKLTINTFKANDITFKQRASKPGEKDLDIEKTSITISKVRLDSASNVEQPVTKLFEELKINNPKIAITSKDKNYQFSFSRIDCNSKNRTLTLDNFSATPTLSEEAFAKKAKIMKDRYDVQLNKVVCRDLDFNALLKGEINIGTVETSNNYFKVFLDISYPPNTESKLGKYPNQLLFKVKSPVKVGKLVLKNTLIEYKEKNPRSDSSGRVTFENSNLTVTNITNRPKGKNDICEWNFTSNLLGLVTVKSQMKFYLYEHEKGRFDITGSIEPTAVSVFNIISRPMSLMNFDKGYVNGAGFNMSGDNYSIKGSVYTNYQDLKISLLKKKQNDKVKKRNVLSVIANLLVKGSNKRKAANQEVQVALPRNTTKSFFYNLWKAIFKGIRDILVLGP